MTKVCLITCYKQPDYIRAKTLRAAFNDIKTVDLIIVKNKHAGFLRYFEVLWELIEVRITKRPDIYFITFRGYEILPFVRILTIGKPLIFDEFINLIEWVVYEHYKLKENSLIAKNIRRFYRFWLKTTNLIITDTKSHAEYSAKLMSLPIERYYPLIVSTDEKTFSGQSRKVYDKKTSFNIFYYGSDMLPLHGVSFVIKTMKLLAQSTQNTTQSQLSKDLPIKLTLVGGKGKIDDDINKAKSEGVNIEYKTWVPFEDLPKYIQSADVCLGGPFGGTVQSQFVITGKTFQFLQMGCPVIIGQNKESKFFTNKHNALVIEQANPESLAEVILWARDHPTKLSQIGKAGQELYQKEFSNKRLAEQLIALLAGKYVRLG